MSKVGRWPATGMVSAASASTPAQADTRSRFQAGQPAAESVRDAQHHRPQPLQPVDELNQQPTAGGQPDRPELGAAELFAQCGDGGTGTAVGVLPAGRSPSRRYRSPASWPSAARRWPGRRRRPWPGARRGPAGGHTYTAAGTASAAAMPQPASRGRMSATGPGDRHRQNVGEQRGPAGGGRRGAEHPGEQHQETDDRHSDDGQRGDGWKTACPARSTARRSAPAAGRRRAGRTGYRGNRRTAAAQRCRRTANRLSAALPIRVPMASPTVTAKATLIALCSAVELRVMAVEPPSDPSCHGVPPIPRSAHPAGSVIPAMAGRRHRTGEVVTDVAESISGPRQSGRAASQRRSSSPASPNSCQR